MKKLIIITVVLAIAAVAGYFGYEQIQAQQEVELTGASEDNLRVDTGIDRVMAEGKIIPLQEVSLSALHLGGSLNYLYLRAIV